MAARTRKGSYLQQIEVKEKLRRETLADGRYVPHSGGLMGWFENSGVLKNEKANNYRFFTALDAEAVRDKLFDRWSDGENINRRASARHDLERDVRATLGWTGGTAKAKLLDFSHHGLRMQILEEEFGLQKGDETQLRLFSGPDRENAVFDINSRVMWIASSGTKKKIWSLGLMFLDFPDSDASRLDAFLN